MDKDVKEFLSNLDYDQFVTMVELTFKYTLTPQEQLRLMKPVVKKLIAEGKLTIDDLKAITDGGTKKWTIGTHLH